MLETDGFRFDTGPSWYHARVPSTFAMMARALPNHAAHADPGYTVFAEPQAGERAERVTVPQPPRGARALERLGPAPGRARPLPRRGQAGGSPADKFFLYNSFERPPTCSPARSAAAPSLPGSGDLVRPARRGRFTHPVLRQILGTPRRSATCPRTPRRSPPRRASTRPRRPVPDGGFGARLPDRRAARTRAPASSRAPRSSGSTPRRAPRAGAPACGCGDDRRRRARAVPTSSCRVRTCTTETRLLAAVDRTYPEAWWRRRTSGPGAVLAMLGVEAAELTHHSPFFTRDWEKN